MVTTAVIGALVCGLSKLDINPGGGGITPTVVLEDMLKVGHAGFD
jgi:hypothetical protein